MGLEGEVMPRGYAVTRVVGRTCQPVCTIATSIGWEVKCQARERFSGDMQPYASPRVDVSFKRPSAEEPKGMSMSQCDEMRLMVESVSACLFDELVKCLRAT